MRRRDVPKTLLAAVAGSTLVARTAEAQARTPPYYARTATEAAVGVTPVRTEYQPGDVRRYGNTLNTTTLMNWAAVGGDLRFPVPQTATIAGTISLPSNCTITFVKGATIETATPNMSLFAAASKTNIKITGGRFRQTVAGNSAYVAGVALHNCSHCEVSDCEFEGMQWAGVYLDSSSHCEVANNHFHDFLASTAGDKTDVLVYRNSSYNTVRGNRCFGGSNAHHGILIQDPSNGSNLPQHNKILHNWVGQHSGYGIAVYIGGGGVQNSYNQVIGNTVEDIIGTYVRGASGTGIYCVGIRLGGLQVLNNIVRNCCLAATSTTNGPGGITVADTDLGSIRAVVSGNTIEEMSQGSGILIVDVAGGAIVSGNTVRMPNSNTGAGRGGAALAGEGIKLIDSNDVAVTGNNVVHNGTRDAFMAFAVTSSFQRIDVTGNIFHAASTNALRFDRTSSHVHMDCVIGGNQLRCDSGGSTLYLHGMDRVTVTGNNGSAGTGAALFFAHCTDASVANNVLNGKGAVGVTTSGTCTGSNYDKTNRVAGSVVNSATGFRIELLSTGVPAVGTYVAGDSVWYRAPAAGSPPGAVCTVGGTPGTWKQMASLEP